MHYASTVWLEILAGIEFGRLKFDGFGYLQSKNDVILTAQPCSCRALSSYIRKSCVSAVCELCSRSPHLWDVSVGEELPCKKDSGNEKNPYAVAVMQRSTIVGHVTKY